MSDRPEHEFYNPYHFIPVEGPSEAGGLDAAAFRAGRLGPFSHALDTRGRFSGRVVCRLTTEGETVVGGVQERVDATEADLWGTGRKVAIPPALKGCAFVRPFMLDGQPAIPAASLRGLVSSLAESVSQSALRVLDDAPLSVRAPINPVGETQNPNPPATLSALGMVKVMADGQGDHRVMVMPLALPTMRLNEDDRMFRFGGNEDNWKAIFPTPLLKSYFGSKKSKGSYQYEEYLKIGKFESYRHDCPKFWYMPLSEWSYTGKRLRQHRNLRRPSRNDQFLIGQLPTDWALDRPLTEYEFGFLKPDPDGNDVPLVDLGDLTWTRGILRVLFDAEIDDQLPRSRDHEIFLPFPEEAERLIRSSNPSERTCGSYRLLDVDPAVIDRFHLLANLLSEEDRSKKKNHARPYKLRGTRSGEELKADVELRTGDIVHFDIDQNGRISVIAFSANWRGWAGTVHQHFRALPQDEPVDPAAAARQGNLLPYGPERTRLTLAEMLFGFATDRSDKDRAGDHAAYAGRVRFGFGLPGGPVANPFGLRRDGRPKSPDAPADYAMMKILGSPKPPSPRLYFIHRKGRGVAKTDLFVESKSASVFTSPTKPQGRKYYLHRSPRSPDWRSRSADENLRKQQNAVLPLRERVDFWFHLDFGNLDATELGLLLYALRPTEAFRHKLGMGKPLGLGTVRIDVAGLFLTDRYQRCAADDPFDAPRYHRAWRDPALAASWPDRYAVERAAAIDPALSVDTLRRGWRDGKDTGRQRAMAALECLGDPATVADRPVQMPYTIEAVQDAARGDPAALEAETFQWFVANEDSKTDGSRQYLRPLVPEGSETATLHPLRLLRKKDTGPKPKKIR